MVRVHPQWSFWTNPLPRHLRNMLRLRPNLYRKHVWQRQAAVQFYGDEAMKLLRDAVAKGFKDAARMKKDSAFDVI
jgi:hypothetical protein